MGFLCLYDHALVIKREKRPVDEARPQVVCLSNVLWLLLAVYLFFCLDMQFYNVDDVVEGCTISHDANEEQLFCLSHDVLYKEVGIGIQQCTAFSYRL